MPPRLSLTSMLLAVTVACAGTETFQPLPHELTSGAAVRITTSASTFPPGAVVGIRVENQGDVEYVWNPCSRTLERATPTGWTPANEGDRVCTSEGWLLEAGTRTDASTQLASELTSGEYRFRYSFWRQEGDFHVNDFQVSNTFTITR